MQNLEMDRINVEIDWSMLIAMKRNQTGWLVVIFCQGLWQSVLTIQNKYKKQGSSMQEESRRQRYPIFERNQYSKGLSKGWHIRPLESSTKQATNKTELVKSMYKRKQPIFSTPIHSRSLCDRTVTQAEKLQQCSSISCHPGQANQCLIFDEDESSIKSQRKLNQNKELGYLCTAVNAYQQDRNHARELSQIEKEKITEDKQSPKLSKNVYLKCDIIIQQQAKLHQNVGQSIQKSNKTNLPSSLMNKSQEKLNPQLKSVNKSKAFYLLDQKKKPKYIAPWVEDLSQRLYDGSFKNQRSKADKGKFKENLQREEFYKMVEQSNIASRLLTPLEIDNLFEQLKTSEPMSCWRSRIVNYQCSKLKKMHQYERLNKSLERV